MYELVTASIQRFGPFTDEQLKIVLNYLKHYTIEKDEFIIKEGQICRDFFFVNQGSFRHYTVLETGVEATINLYVEGDWVFEYKSFVSQQPSAAFIQANERSDVFVLSTYDFHELVKISDSFFRMGKIFEQAIQNQDFQHNRLNPEEKYELLLSTKPQLIQKFPLKQIASYLGMTPETLSRIRKKISS
jgi:CRP-like cAMP-binding protein